MWMTWRIAVLSLIVSLWLWSNAYAATIYFQAHGETADLTEWTASGGGYCDQCCSPDQQSTLCSPVTTQHHTGSYAFKLDVADPGSGIQGLKLTRWDYGSNPSLGIQLGETYYFSSWYYLGAGYTFADGGKWHNMMQWKTDGGTSIDNTLFIGIRYASSVRSIILDHWACHVAGAVPCQTFSGYTQYSTGQYAQTTPKTVPLNQWFQVETKYFASRTNGRITVWQDGIQIFDLTSSAFNTWDSFSTTHTSLTASATNYMDPTITGQQLMYVDDFYVTDYQVGADTLAPNAPTNLRAIPH